MCLGIPAQIVEIPDDTPWMAVVDVDGVRRTVSINLLGSGQNDEEDPAKVGDWVLIHVGFALCIIDAKEAERTLELLREMGALFQEELAQLQASRIQGARG